MDGAPKFMKDGKEVYFSEYCAFVEKENVHYTPFVLEAISWYLYEVQKIEYIELDVSLIIFLSGHIQHADDYFSAIAITRNSNVLLNDDLFNYAGDRPNHARRLLKQFGWFSAKYDFDLDFDVYIRIKH